jgi:formylglycine-generating enzyme required for sulfatase activity
LRAIVTLSGIDEAIKDLGYTNDKHIKTRFIKALRQYYSDENSIRTVTEINPDDLIRFIWDTGGSHEAIRHKRKNFSSIKSSINSDLTRLYNEGKNPEGVVIGKNNTFDMSDKAKNELLENFTSSAMGDGLIPLGKINDVFGIVNDILKRSKSGGGQDTEDDKSSLDQLKELIHSISQKIGLSNRDNQETGSGKGETGGKDDLDLSGDGTQRILAGESVEELDDAQELDEVEDDIEEVDELPAEEEEIIDDAEVIDAAEDLEEVDAGEVEDEVEVADAAEVLELDAEEVPEDEVEEVEELNDAQELDEVEDDIEEVDELPVEEEQIVDDAEAIDAVEHLEEVDDEEIEDEVEDADAAEDLEELDTDEIPEDDVEEVEELDNAQELDDVEDDIEEVYELPAEEEEIVDDSEVIDAAEDLEEVDADEIPEDDVEEVEEPDDAQELDEVEDDIEEVDELPAEEEEIVDDAEVMDAAEDLEEVDAEEIEDDNEVVGQGKGVSVGDTFNNLDKSLKSVDEEGTDIGKAKLLAEEFNNMLSAMDRFYNQYILIPKGRYQIRSNTIFKDDCASEKVDLSSFYFGKFPITNALFEVFIEKTGYITTAERAGRGTVYYGRYQNIIDNKTGMKTLNWSSTLETKVVEGACWYQPIGPGSTLYNKRNHPVVQISLEDAMAFASWTGKRLPTEAQWEAAATTLKGNKYPWGKEFERGQCNLEDSYIGDTTPVDNYVRSENNFGIMDLLGNVMEWTIDKEKPSGEDRHASGHIVKGGSWISGNDLCLYDRFLADPAAGSNILGFRCITY